METLGNHGYLAARYTVWPQVTELNAQLWGPSQPFLISACGILGSPALRDKHTLRGPDMIRHDVKTVCKMSAEGVAGVSLEVIMIIQCGITLRCLAWPGITRATLPGGRGDDAAWLR